MDEYSDKVQQLVGLYLSLTDAVSSSDLASR
jgi:hypothetical protein